MEGLVLELKSKQPGYNSKFMKGFIREFQEKGKTASNSLWFVFQGDNLLINSTQKETGLIPKRKRLSELNINSQIKQYIGRYNNITCYSVFVSDDTPAPENMNFCNLRRLFGILNPDMFYIAGYARQIIRWEETTQYCGKCGSVLQPLESERAKECMKCGLIIYPRISPAIIVSILKKEKILLARSSRFKGNIYSVLAGFVEPGESLEDCISREVKEEVNIEVENIRYFGSQPWPFPDSLMIAFIADYKDGEICLDNDEIIDASWYSRDDLPEIPKKASIAREMIDWFVETTGKR